MTANITLESLHTQLTELLAITKHHHDETKARGEQLLLRFETQLLNRSAPKRGICKKDNAKDTKDVKDAKKPGTKKDTIPNTFANTMYWWACMYATDHVCVAESYSAAEEKVAKESSKEAKNKTAYENKRQVGILLWKSFTTEKKGIMKAVFDSWKKDLEKDQAKDVEAEPHTDDESDECIKY